MSGRKNGPVNKAAQVKGFAKYMHKAKYIEITRNKLILNF
jgi:hypothetical protein